jgi:predicted nucleic acid-binding protein
VKLPLQEGEQEALLAELAQWDGYVSSSLLGVEAIRACERYGEGYAADARSFLMDMSLLPLEDTVLAVAASIEPATLRSLDAVHLATALSIRDEIGAFITYDQRLGQAAAGQGLVVTQPS